jgi:hypothetical protein
MEYPSLELETGILVKTFQKWVESNQLSRLEKLFPVGFGSMAEEVRRWRS